MVLNFYRVWPQLTALGLLVIGFIFSISVWNSAALTYILIIIFGLGFGRMWWKYKNDFRFTWFLLMVGFIIGYLIGAFGGSRIITFILYILSIAAGYYIHEKNILHSKEF